MDNRETAEAFVANITREYIKNGMMDGRPEWRFTERLTRDVEALLAAYKPSKPKPKPTKPKPRKSDKQASAIESPAP